MALPNAQPGKRYKVKGETWNVIADKINRLPTLSGEPTVASDRNSGIVRIKNISGSEVQRYGVLKPTDVIFDPATDVDVFKNNFGLQGDTPVALEQFVITLENIPADKIGVAMICGCCQVPITGSGEDAVVASTSTTELDAVDFADLADGDVYGILISKGDAWGVASFPFRHRAAAAEDLSEYYFWYPILWADSGLMTNGTFYVRGGRPCPTNNFVNDMATYGLLVGVSPFMGRDPWTLNPTDTTGQFTIQTVATQGVPYPITLNVQDNATAEMFADDGSGLGQTLGGSGAHPNLTFSVSGSVTVSKTEPAGTRPY